MYLWQCRWMYLYSVLKLISIIMKHAILILLHQIKSLSLNQYLQIYLKSRQFHYILPSRSSNNGLCVRALVLWLI